MDIQKIFDKIEKVFRYLIPAFVFTVLLAHFEPETYKNYNAKLDGAIFIFYFVLVGITIYSIHRILFEVIDFIIFRVIFCKDKDAKTISDIIADSLNYAEKDKLDFFYYKQATIHSVLVTMELIAIFLWRDGLIKTYSFLLCILLFVISLVVYVGFYIVQIRFVKNLPQNAKKERI